MSLNVGHSAQEEQPSKEEILARLDGRTRALFEEALASGCITESKLIALMVRCFAEKPDDFPLADVFLAELQEQGIIDDAAAEEFLAAIRPIDKLFTPRAANPDGGDAPLAHAADAANGAPTEFPQIPGFRFIKKLGSGGQGTVYLAEQEQGILKRNVAVKIFKNGGSGQYFARMKREVNASAKLPNSITGRIVVTYDAQPLPGGNGYYAVMEYVEGGESLGEIEKGKKSPLKAEEVWDIAQDLLETLQVFEEQGVAHRDIKPANILVSGKTVKIADFGLVKMEGHQQEGHQQESFATEEGTILGTMAYLDPDNTKDARFDVYSLAMTVRCLLTGTLPFSDEAKNPRTLIHAHRSFSHKMEEYSQSRRAGGWSMSHMASSSPEWVPALRNPQSDYEKALAYLCERASLPMQKRPMPSALLSEIGERFPDLMGDESSRRRVDTIRKKTRKTVTRIVGATVATLGLAGAAGLYIASRGGGESKEGHGKAPVVTVGGSEGKKTTEGTKKAETAKKFAEMTEEEKQAFIEKIAVNAVGSPVPVDENIIEVLGTDLKIDWRTMPQVKGKNVWAGVFYFTEEQEKKIAEYFRSNGTPVVGTPSVNGAPQKRYGLVFKFLDNGQEKGTVLFPGWIGAGVHLPSRRQQNDTSLMYPCINANQKLEGKQKFVGLHNPDFRQLFFNADLPPREEFVLPQKIDPGFAGDANYDFYWYIDANFKMYQKMAAAMKQNDEMGK